MVKPISAGAGVTSMMNKKKTKGKRKIDMKKIENPDSRLVAFSKRRAGLFKKAAEICVLTGAQVAILVTSPRGRVFTFRHPNTDVLIDDYLDYINNKENILTTTTTTNNNNSPLGLPLMSLNRHYFEVSRELEAEKKRGVMIPVSGGGSRWYDEGVDGLEVEELEGYLCSLEELKKKVLTRANELMIINNASSSSSSFFASSNNNFQSAGTFEGGFNVKYSAGDI